MKRYDLVKNFLTSYPQARERKNRAKVIWYLLEKITKSPSEKQEIESMSKQFFIDHFSDIQTINRTVNRVQQLEPDLRGIDYMDKEELEQKVQLDQGYTPGYYKDLKKLKTL